MQTAEVRELFPASVNILGLEYSVEYVEKPSDVDMFKRESLWGQIDYWTRSIRIYANETTPQDVCQTLLHEVIHGIVVALHMDVLKDEKHHDDLDLLATALVDVALRNGWVELPNE